MVGRDTTQPTRLGRLPSRQAYGPAMMVFRSIGSHATSSLHSWLVTNTSSVAQFEITCNRPPASPSNSKNHNGKIGSDFHYLPVCFLNRHQPVLVIEK